VGGEVPHHLPQGDHPLGAEDNVVAGERHDVEVDAEVLAVDGDRCLAEDARACDAFPVGHRGGKTRAGVDSEAGTCYNSLHDEVVHGARI
jgi:hypothetical protein